jgi:integrase/recombinase XerD
VIATLNVEGAIEDYLETLVHARGKKESTARKYGHCIRDFVTKMEVADLCLIDHALIERYLGRLGILGRSADTKIVTYYALRSFFAWLVARGAIPLNPILLVEKPEAGEREQIPVFSRKEIERLIYRAPESPELRRGRREPPEFFQLRVEDHHLTGLRNRALLGLSYNCALRANEPGNLGRGDYDELDGWLDIHGGKAQKEPETLQAHKRTRVLMSVYLDALRGSRWGMHPSLFPPIGHRRSDSRRTEKGVGPTAVNMILRKQVALAGIEANGRRISPHIFRYTLATHLDEMGWHPQKIMRVLRHKSVTTTLKYIRRSPLRRLSARANRVILMDRDARSPLDEMPW